MEYPFCHCVSKITLHHDTTRAMVERLSQYDLTPHRVIYIDKRGQSETLDLAAPVPKGKAQCVPR